MANIMYVSHPVTPELKADIRKQGYKIVDIRFKPDELPDGQEVYESKQKRKTRKPAE